jgi:hypothetical protein
MLTSAPQRRLFPFRRIGDVCCHQACERRAKIVDDDVKPDQSSPVVPHPSTEKQALPIWHPVDDLTIQNSRPHLAEREALVSTVSQHM